MTNSENIDIDKSIFKNINIDIDKAILQNINIVKILYQFEFAISNSTIDDQSGKHAQAWQITDGKPSQNQNSSQLSSTKKVCLMLKDGYNANISLISPTYDEL